VRDVEVPTVNDMPFTSSVYLIFCFNFGPCYVITVNTLVCCGVC